MARHRPDAEETLNVVTGFGLTVAVFLASAALTHFNWETKQQGWDFRFLATLTALFIVAHAPLKWWPPAVRLAQLAWAALVVFCVAFLWRLPFFLAVIVVLPIAISIKLWRVGDRLAEYLKGTLDAANPLPADPFTGDACAVCGERSCDIVAHQWCFSFVYAAVRQIGRPRRLCSRHARLYAVRATIISGILGWWSIWGLVWTPAALMQNLADGGQILDEETGLAGKGERGPAWNQREGDKRRNAAFCGGFGGGNVDGPTSLTRCRFRSRLSMRG